MHSRSRWIAGVVWFALLGACGGGTVATTATFPTFVVLQGAAFKGQFLSGVVVGSDADFGNQLFEVPLSAGGAFASEFELLAAEFVACRVSGVFLNEATQLSESTGAYPLRATFRPAGQVTVNVTVLSSLVAVSMEYLCLINPTLTKKEKEELAAGSYGDLFSIADTNVAPAPTSGDPLKVWLLGAGFCALSNGIGIPTTELVDLCARAWQDGSLDNMFDGTVLAAENGTELPADPRAALHDALVDFILTNPSTPAGLTLADQDVLELLGFVSVASFELQ